MLTFNKQYFSFAVILFITEVLIAVYVHDRIIRPYVGDYLVVILLYCSVKSFFNVPVRNAALGTLLFSYLVEVLQYLNILAILGLQSNQLATVVIGYNFEWIDILAYTLGIISILGFEQFKNKKYSVTGSWF
ncbi:MAG: hypothetical protein COW65_08275 [Cytophagales bacterium CG18_big_fil_WC_8_21_14_2_50_42_9]|nr:MAG: hypothetical protein COW65_08275 [Cytophagales bacterium CG18_big_fil_WC_8_21_14_2_50_42_9]